MYLLIDIGNTKIKWQQRDDKDILLTDSILVEEFMDIDFSSIKSIDKIIVSTDSEKIAEILIKNGFSQTKNLFGGIFDWINSGYPVYKDNVIETTKIHPYNESWGKWLTKGDKVYE